MIPAFDEDGHLPPGIHPATLAEIEERFGQVPELRRVQFESLRRMVELAGKAGVRRIIINGSDVTDAYEPNDVDCVLLIDAGMRFVMSRRFRGCDSMSTWKRTDVFPIIAAKIEQLSAARPGFVPHDAIVAAILDDPEAAAIVETAHHAEPERSPEWLAHNMLAWFSQRISAGESEWADRFDRDEIDGKWAYRPRRER